ncbi:MAG: hypothetical protein HFH50_14775 [Lachnospiraceae bacterium]|nr:hypothetical protein [Lachnospiraceae bacterium]MCI8873119.1 hypothetical protein [Lachnospiraceae bacterium]MCI9059854.1 hypothetical protein [Lachnospiraceae bacterium]GFI31081.1 hypothetical protein IMSAGC013_02475 [Lachnospiraceae bacterium]
MATWQIVLIVITVLLLAATIALYIMGKKSQKKKEEQDAQIAAASQTISMLVIDKKRMKLKDAGLPPAVLEQTPKMLRGSKMPIVKAKVGPKIMTFICEGEIFDRIPTKKEVKAVVSGLYITSVKGLRGPIEPVAKKKKFWDRFKKEAQK